MFIYVYGCLFVCCLQFHQKKKRNHDLLREIATYEVSGWNRTSSNACHGITKHWELVGSLCIFLVVAVIFFTGPLLRVGLRRKEGGAHRTFIHYRIRRCS